MNPSKTGLTQREKAIWPPKKQIDGFDFMEKCFWFAVFAVLISLVIHTTIEPKGTTPIVKGQTTQLGMSDRDQEKLYCSEWVMGQEAVVGGTTDAIRKHCSEFLN